jgi:pimeloyl-ACP methyl ester carboxylesterase
MHGVHANRLAMLRRARLFNAEGFAVLLFDFQAHGESTGTRITFGLREGQDAAAAIAYMRTHLPGEHVGAIGSSLGGAAALLAPQPLDVDALVLESVYSEISAAIENRMIAVLGPLGAVAAPPITALFKLLLPPFLGVSPADLRPIDRIADVRAPILVAGGMLDDRTSIVETRRMFARANEPKRLWEVPRARHVDLEGFTPAEYREHVLAFMIETLRQ